MLLVDDFLFTLVSKQIDQKLSQYDKEKLVKEINFVCFANILYY